MKYTPPVLTQSFENTPVPLRPDYSKAASWAALPDKKDFADLTPANTSVVENQKNAKADVFFIHPTTYTYPPQTKYLWNGNMDDDYLNKRTDESAIKNQASVFNAAAKVYAPRYRQANIYSFFTDQAQDGEASIAIAYSDVKAAFEYYINNYNQGRPFIIASHSQGTIHAGKLIKEFIENKALEKQFIIAYLIGIPVPKNYFATIKTCENETETGCIVSWNTFAEGFIPNQYKERGYSNAVCVNPLTWTTSNEKAERKHNLGGVVWNYKVIPAINNAQVNDGLLWICKPYIKGRMFYKVNNYHIGDYNLFYENIRKNAVDRVNSFLKK